MSINAERMLADVPAAFHVEILDADGTAHDAVITGVGHQSGAADFGFPAFSTGDTVYLAAPFDLPAGALTITGADGETVKRRILDWTDWAAFLAVNLGEVLA